MALAIGLGLVAALLVAPAQAGACSCSAEWTPKRWLKQADAAIIGKLRRIDDDPNPGAGPAIGHGKSTFVYRIGNLYKGRGRGLERGESIRVRTSSNESTCGLPRYPGRRIGLYLDRRRGRWHGALCASLPPREMKRAIRQARRGKARDSRTRRDGLCDRLRT